MSYDSTVDTVKHIEEVQKLMCIFANNLLKRAELHDASKLEEPEKAVFDEYTPKLKDSTYGSEEYNNFLKEMRVALDHHYSTNMHHPEFFDNGIRDMSLITIVEMFCDWWAASKRHTDGDMLTSIEYNQKRFGYNDELKQIFIQTYYIMRGDMI